MKKEYTKPSAMLIELKMSENIADSQTDIPGNWEFSVEVQGRCFDNVQGDYSSLLEDKHYTSKQELLDDGFQPFIYAVQISQEYTKDTMWMSIIYECSKMQL